MRTRSSPRSNMPPTSTPSGSCGSRAAALTDDDCATVRAVIDGRLADLKEPQ
ncbi:hypothetical protein GS475_10460 [Rhodococcus hoagii]|nr:hypothetical protein [Prescottella equi]